LVKTKGSMCVAPVHPELVKLGLLDFHAARGRAPSGCSLRRPAISAARWPLISPETSVAI
jgi:hypothetical protein